MMKKIITLICVVALTASMSLTAFAAPSPSAKPVQSSEDRPKREHSSKPKPKSTPATTETTTTESLVAPRVNLQITSTDAAIAVTNEFKNVVTAAPAQEAFKVSVMDALQQCVGTHIKVLNVMNVKNVTNTPATPVLFNVPGVTAADSVKILAYNDVTGIWEYIPAISTEGAVYAELGLQSRVVFFVDGVVPEELRVQTPNTISGSVSFLNGGKDQNTAIELSSNTLEAPFTGDVNMTYVMFAALGCIALALVTGRKLSYNN